MRLRFHNLRLKGHFKLIVAIAGCVATSASQAAAFEGKIHVVLTQGSQTDALLYTVGTNFLRVDMTATNWPNPVDILDRKSGALMLLFPHNRSFVRLKPNAENPSTPGPRAMPMPPGGLPPGIGPQPRLGETGTTPGLPAAPAGAPQIPLPSGGLPPGIGPQSQPGTPPGPLATAPGTPQLPLPPGGLPPGIGPQSPGAPAPGAFQMPPIPMPMMMEKTELKATGQTTNLLGFTCQRYEIKQRGEMLEVWATDQLFAYQPYVRNQPHRFGPRMIEEQWPALLTAKKLFPLRASLRFDEGTERFRFEVQSVTPQKLTDEDAQLFHPPSGYFEIQPLPF